MKQLLHVLVYELKTITMSSSWRSFMKSENNLFFISGLAGCLNKKSYLSSLAFKNLSLLSGFNLKGILMDITGVLYESGEKGAIDGSVQAIERLRSLRIPFKFVTNESMSTQQNLVKKLQSFGFSLTEKDIFSPGIAASAFLKKKGLRPFLLVHPDILPEFDGCDQSSPNCVVIGDAAEHFTYQNMNKAFQILFNSENQVLISLGKGRYYKDNNELVLDLGGFTAALEYAAGVSAKIIGKPDPDFFLDALNSIGVKPNEAIMIGDDINSDVHAAQKCGLRGVLVKTGKYRAVDVESSPVKPDAVVNNLAQFINLL